MSDSKYNNFPDASYGGMYKNAGALNENSNMNDSDMGDNIFQDEEDDFLDENVAIENL